MKKLFLGSLLAVCALLMTSCLDGGKNEYSGVGFGVVGYSEKSFKPVLHMAGGVTFYSPEIDKNVTLGKISPNDCALVGYYVDNEIPENSPENVAAYGFTTATITNYTNVPRIPFSFQLQDTTVVDPDEMLVSMVDNLNTGLAFVKKDLWKILIATNHDDFVEGQKQEFSLSYNPEQEPEIVNGEKVYDFYLRVVKTQDGEKTLTTQQGLLNAADATQFVNAIKAKGEKTLSFRINCVKKLNEDKTKIAEWISSEVKTYPLPEEE